MLWGSGRCTQDDSGTHCSRGNSSSAIGSPPGNFTLTNRSTGLLDQNAVAEEQVFDLEYFRHLKEFTCGWKQHNATMKWFREECEKNGTKQMTFSNWSKAGTTQEIIRQELEDCGGGRKWSKDPNDAVAE